MNSFHYEKHHGKTRGRPKSKPDESKEGNKYYFINWYNLSYLISNF